MKRFLPLLLFLCLALALALALLQKPKHDILALGGEAMDKPLPALALQSRQGKALTLDTKALGGKVTVVNFFASWCTACAIDHHEMLDLARTHPDAAFLGVAWNDTPERIDDWLMQHGNPFTRIYFDKDGRSAIALGLRGLPESYVIDGKGNIRYHLAGPLTPSLRADTIGPLLERLEKES
jgi:cytochrome c biogenesis protein CcmG/thiol:disulfide interchange protein DsbE